MCCKKMKNELTSERSIDDLSQDRCHFAAENLRLGSLQICTTVQIYLGLTSTHLLQF